MKKSLVLAALLAAAPFAATAGELSYNYVELGYANVDVDVEGTDIDFDGFQLVGGIPVALALLLEAGKPGERFRRRLGCAAGRPFPGYIDYAAFCRTA